jgi:hypothetical protein
LYGVPVKPAPISKIAFFVIPTQVTMAPVTPPLADVLNTYIRHVVREVYPEQDLHKGLEKAIRSYTVELQRKNKSESEIYKLLDEMNPVLGNPLTFYEEFVMKYDESYKNAAKAQKKVAKEAATASSRALTEITNKRKCHKLEQATCNKQSKTSELTTQSIKMQANQGLLDITPGTYVGMEARPVTWNVFIRRQWFHQMCQRRWRYSHVHCEL